jgi:hypothetical protein
MGVFDWIYLVRVLEKSVKGIWCLLRTTHSYVPSQILQLRDGEVGYMEKEENRTGTCEYE